MCIRVAICTLRKIAIEGVNDGVLFLVFSSRPGPLPDAWTASIGEYLASNGLKVLE